MVQRIENLSPPNRQVLILDTPTTEGRTNQLGQGETDDRRPKWVSIAWFAFFVKLAQYVNDLIHGNLSAVPVGFVGDYAGSTAPAGWLFCDGSAISRVTYSALFIAIGTTYGVGDGSTTFNIPDVRGRTRFGFDAGNATGRLTNAAAGGISAAALGNSGGDETHALTIAETPSITTASNTAIAGAANRMVGFTGPNGAAHNIVNPGIVFNVMIFTGVTP